MIGRVALHYAAVSCPSLETMTYLIEKYPQGVKAFDTNRRLPLHNLIARCDKMNPIRMACLKLLLRVYPLAAGRVFIFEYIINVNLLKYNVNFIVI